MDDTLKTCREFVEVLASASPTPGGGGAAALAGAVGTALCGMVASLTAGKKTYAAVEEEIQSLLAETAVLRTELLEQVQADAEGFLPLQRAYGLAKDDPSRGATLEAASLEACRVPMHIMELCVQGLHAAERLAEIGSRLAVSDAGCAAALLRGALEAASLNVLVNTRTMTDRAAAEAWNERCLTLLKDGTERGEQVFRTVQERLL